MLRLLTILLGSGMFAAAFAILRAVLRPHLLGLRPTPRDAASNLPTVEWLRANVPLTKRLAEHQWPTLLARMQDLLDTRHWAGCGGLELTDQIRHTVAAQAALLVLALPGDPYPKLREILIYPATFRPRKFSWTSSGDDDHGGPTLGESWNVGVVILAWDSARAGTINPLDGDNVVLHEFSHQLDTLDGVADGIPPLATQVAYSAWTAALASGFVQLCRDARRDRPSVLDHYGATNHAEFFAVATEAFFEKPHQLHRRMPELYAVLADYYGQDMLGPSSTAG